MENMDEIDRMTKVFQMAKIAQTRFALLPLSSVNPIVVQAGIRDMSLGKYGL